MYKVVNISSCVGHLGKSPWHDWKHARLQTEPDSLMWTLFWLKEKAEKDNYAYMNMCRWWPAARSHRVGQFTELWGTYKVASGHGLRHMACYLVQRQNHFSYITKRIKWVMNFAPTPQNHKNIQQIAKGTVRTYIDWPSSAGSPEPKKILLGRRSHQSNFLQKPLLRWKSCPHGFYLSTLSWWAMVAPRPDLSRDEYSSLTIMILLKQGRGF